MRSLSVFAAAPVRRGLAVALYVGVAVATVAIVEANPEFSLAGDSRAALAAALAAGALLIATALTARPSVTGRARFPALLVATAVVWPLAEWNTPGAGAAFTVGLVLSAAWAPLLAAAALRGPDERHLSRPALCVLGVAFATSVGVLGIASAAVFDPQAQGCVQCPANRLLVAGDADAWHAAGQTGLALSAAWTAAFAVLAFVRLLRSSPARRRIAAPVLVPSVAALALFGAGALHGLDRGFLSNDPIDRALWVAEISALALVAAGVAWGRVRTRRTRSALARLVVDLGASSSPGGLRERLATTLDDPSLELLHGVGDGTSWIDADGRAATPSTGPDRELTRVVAEGRGICALAHRPGLLDDSALTAEIAVVARLALEHERLHALRLARLEELRTSRARIVAAADAERRRLERDLHDGAQQRLVTLAIGVRLARRAHAAGDAALDGELAAAEQELQAAVGGLRELAHGLFPSALGEEGLAAAIEVLAEHEPRLVVGALPGARCAPPVESAAYFLVSEALRLAATGAVQVDSDHGDGRLVVDVHTAHKLAEPPIRAEDRAGAVGGTLTSGPHHLRAELPCGS